MCVAGRHCQCVGASSKHTQTKNSPEKQMWEKQTERLTQSEAKELTELTHTHTHTHKHICTHVMKGNDAYLLKFNDNSVIKSNFSLSLPRFTDMVIN